MTIVSAPSRIATTFDRRSRYSLPSQHGSRNSRTFATTPSNHFLAELRGVANRIKDRGMRALGRKTSEDKEVEKMVESMLPNEQRSLARLYRKRWGAPKEIVDPVTGERSTRIEEHKYSTAAFRISPRKLQLLADQIGGGKPVDYSILQMQFSHKRAAKRVKSTLALARDHAIAKGMDPARLVVSEAWVGKGQTFKRIEFKGRGRFGMQTRFQSRLSIVLREGKTFDTKLAEKMEKEKRRVRSIGTGGVVRVNRPIINEHQRPGWRW